MIKKYLKIRIRRFLNICQQLEVSRYKLHLEVSICKLQLEVSIYKLHLHHLKLWLSLDDAVSPNMRSHEHSTAINIKWADSSHNSCWICYIEKWKFFLSIDKSKTCENYIMKSDSRKSVTLKWKADIFMLRFGSKMKLEYN